MKRIGIFLFEYPLGVSALVINSALLLAREDYEVHIFIDTPTFELATIHFDDDNIVIHAIDIAEKSGAKTPRMGTFNKLAQLIVQTIPSLYGRVFYRYYRLRYDRGTSIEKLRRQTRDFFPGLSEFCQKTAEWVDHTYVCLLGVDVNGLIAGTLVAESRVQDRRPPTVYYNMELLLESHAFTLRHRVLKALERICTDLCYFVVIQDVNRGAFFAKDNDVPNEKLVYVPVSGLREPYRGRSDYLREMFAIGPDKKILLNAGGFASWTMCLELAEAANNWGDDLVLVLHSSRRYVDAAYLDRIKRAARSEKVYISLNPVDWEKVPDLIASADIGLVFYEGTDPNVLEIGRSSNKLVQYLQVGLPIIAIDFPSLNELIRECRCGETTGDPNEIEGLARQILSDYSAYRKHSFECYAERYNITRYFDRVLEKIKQIG